MNDNTHGSCKFVRVFSNLFTKAFYTSIGKQNFILLIADEIPYKNLKSHFAYENSISLVKMFQFHMWNASFTCKINCHMWINRSICEYMFGRPTFYLRNFEPSHVTCLLGISVYVIYMCKRSNFIFEVKVSYVKMCLAYIFRRRNDIWNLCKGCSNHRTSCN